MTDTRERLDHPPVPPDWAMPVTVALLVAGWLSWFAVAAYRLIMVT
jgi:hypothetical protein